MKYITQTKKNIEFNVKYWKWWCGMITMQSIIQYKTNELYDYKELKGNMISKTWYIFPRSIKKILARYNIESRISNYNSKDNTIEFIKQKIQKWPLILLIGHAFKKWRDFSYLWALSQHYVSIWGFDDERKVFYIHNSKPHKKFLDNLLPVWNMEVKYDVLMKAWNFSYFWLRKNLYIEIV